MKISTAFEKNMKDLFLLDETLIVFLTRRATIKNVSACEPSETKAHQEDEWNMERTKGQNAMQSQKLMVFVLTMALYGLSSLFTELIPKFQVGLVEFSVEYFLFIPLTLAMLFDPMSVALGAATGELVFSEIMLGQFGGLGELEKFLTVTIGVYLAGRMVQDPTNRRMVGIAAITGTALQLLMGMGVDIMKVQFAVEDFEAVPGLPQSVFATEGFAFLNDLLFSGTLFCLLPTLFLVPRLHGKIEPLLGMRPRSAQTGLGGINLRVILAAVLAFAVAAGCELLATSGMPLIEWEAEWAESGVALAVGMVVAAAAAVVTLAVLKLRSGKEQVAQR